MTAFGRPLPTAQRLPAYAASSGQPLAGDPQEHLLCPIRPEQHFDAADPSWSAGVRRPLNGHCKGLLLLQADVRALTTTPFELL
ncbi:hypothetical protein [Mucilaginibacter sp. OK098]|uniref:hypothetical protein n=1 Tax=Mucilaginibacter sp. OK098 TaxID=1855297 RepID=UPI000932454B|nr:hypothetical protein [Mucilaginibacter sp. OK098]